MPSFTRLLFWGFKKMNDVYKYPLDSTGLDPNNLVIGEVQPLPAGLNRAIVPTAGAFFTESLKVYDQQDNRTLVPNVDYVATQLHETATNITGKEICCVVVVMNPTVSDTVRLDYQVVGGTFSNLTPIIENMVERLNLDERVVKWGDLLDKPDKFPPTPHLHDIGDLYGFEYLVESLANLRDAVLMGDVSTMEEIRSSIYLLNSKFESHRDDTTNPHDVTKTQVGLSQVENYPIATKAIAEAGVSTSTYMTPLRVKEAITAQVGNDFKDHIEDYSNPHRVTKAQVGLGDVENYSMATSAEALSGTRNDRYMSPLRVKEAITAFANGPLEDHISDFNNPHQVTKAQVGLGNVANYPMSTSAEAVSGARNDRYMSPLRVKEMIENYTSEELRALFVQTNQNIDTSIRVLSNPTRVQVYGGGSWRQVWPPQWVS